MNIGASPEFFELTVDLTHSGWQGAVKEVVPARDDKLAAE